MSAEETPELGITEADRRRMREWASRDTSKHANPETGNKPDPDDPLVRDVRLEVAIRKHVDGNTYVKAKHLTDGLGYSASQIGVALGVLADVGDLERVGYNRSTNYRIAL